MVSKACPKLNSRQEASSSVLYSREGLLRITLFEGRIECSREASSVLYSRGGLLRITLFEGRIVEDYFVRGKDC